MRIKVSDKRQFDIAIINPEVNPGLAKLLNPVVKEFINKNKLCQSNRGFCVKHSNDFITWLKNEYPVLHKNLLKKGLELVKGLYKIDNPEKLYLEPLDLYEDEWEDFLDKYEDDYFYIEKDKKEVSELIWKWAQESLERLDDFYYVTHGWIKVEGLIIDFTWLQFRRAINDKNSLRKRYMYL